MPTHCRPDSLDFGSVEGRTIVAGFDGGEITSDGGALLLAKTNKAIRLIERVAPAFTDWRNPDLIEHSVATLVGQRIMGEALGYPDINDHDLLRHDPLLAAVMGKLTARDKRCAPLAGKSTLNRLEHSPQEGEGRAPGRYHKISHDGAAIDRLFLEVFKEAYASPPKIVVLDPDATDVALHGNQEGRHYHGYYDSYCYLPLYIFCDRHLLTARLRPASVDAASGIVEEIARIVAFIREHWPETTIVVRADSGFCRDNLMTWCEDNDVHFVLGCAKTAPLIAEIKPELAEAETEHKATGHAARRFKSFDWTTRKSWTRERRVVAKAEWTEGEANPRFIVTSMHEDVIDARALYEDVYCKRGEMENRIKETQSDLFGDRMPATTMRANQLRMYFSALAYVLMCASCWKHASGMTPDRARRHGPGARDVRHASSPTAEDRCAGDGLGAPREDRARNELPLARAVQHRSRAIVSRRALTPRPPKDQPQRNIDAPAPPASAATILAYLPRSIAALTAYVAEMDMHQE